MTGAEEGLACGSRHMHEEKKDGFVVRDRRLFADGEGDGDGDGADGGETAGALEEAARDEAARDEALHAEIELLRSALADLEQAKDRIRRENERELERLRGEVLAGLVPVLDNLDRSLAAARGTRNVEALIQGVELVQSQLLAALEGYGLERVASLGQRFDPALHDAVAVVPVDDPRQDGVVVSELAPAYRFGDRVVRPARVQVGRAADRPSA